MRTRKKIFYYTVLVNTIGLVLVYFGWGSLGSESKRYESSYDGGLLRSFGDNHVLFSLNDISRQQELTMRMKLDQVEGKCQNYSKRPHWNTLTPSGEVWNYKKLNLYYCIVPKVGCTYWKRILRFISRDYPQDANIRKPSDISRYFVHYGPHASITEYTMSSEQQRKSMTNKAFMFTRNPYSRLWSAYIDKFLLPDFWGKGRELNMFASEHPTEKEIACNDGMTFKDFLTAITRNWRKNKQLNEHFEPIHKLCSPCHVKFTAIGKMENFKEDTDYILSRYGISLNQNTSSGDITDAVYEEIKTLTRYNFAIESIISKECLNKRLVAQRLWKAFQYNGYLNRLTPFPSKEFENSDFELNPKKTFLDIMKTTIGNQTGSFKSQKQSLMLEAYKGIPLEVLDQIKRIYKYDFELFGYEPDLFS